MSGIRVGIDTGGTFTDVVAMDDAGRAITTKTPSTPGDPAQGFMHGLRKGLELLGAEDGVGVVSHGTTVATNALLQEDFSGLGFVTTDGFRHVLEIARQSVPEGYGNSYFWVKPARIVPLHHVKEVPERLDAEGNVVRPFDESAAADVARWFRERGFTAVAICFVNSYVNPEHERRMRDVFAHEFPECAVSASSDVLREYREYERSMTTLIDAFVKPRVTEYVNGIGSRLDQEAPGAPFYVMKSNGGVTSAAEVGEAPITTVLSGPAAGVLGAAVVAAVSGFDPVLTLDAGGTSTDVSVVHGGEPTMTTEGAVGRFPVKTPMVDIVTVGTGGGSIAWVAPDGGLKVGPRSAGADPGPLCYGHGGTEPTTTDAHLLLGRLPPHLLGGEIPLDSAASRAGFERLAGDLGMEPEVCAEGVLEIAAWNQANAIRQVTVRRGLDVRDFAMVAFGGSGPLQACMLLDVLGLDAAVIPRDPGVLSAYGLLTVDVKNDYVQTFVRRSSDLDVAELRASFAALHERARDALNRQGFGDGEHIYVRSADLRYAGQAFEARVGAPPSHIDEGFTLEVVARFHDEHERLYGYCYRDDSSHGVEWVNLRVSGLGPIDRPVVARIAVGDGDAGRALKGERRVRLGGEWVSAALFDRSRLRAGDTVTGPCVVEEFGSTTPIPSGYAGRVDGYGNLVIRAAAS